MKSVFQEKAKKGPNWIIQSVFGDDTSSKKG